ncbi:MAG TPA: hypothetical protein VFB66_25290 [Tepidisphaeraceae bacterium]|nr:hypothetical protein [Tepidisphaeraceae bacterium]
MIKLDAGNVLLKPSQRRQLMARLRRSLRMGARLGGFLMTIRMWRSGRQFELRADVRDAAGSFGCRARRNDFAEAVHELVRLIAGRLHGQTLRAHAA